MPPSSELDLRNGDILIVFMGPTGSGKSNIIDHLANDGKKRAGGDLEPTTKDITIIRIRGHATHGDNLVLVDTPGLDNPKIPDKVALNTIKAQLEKYQQKAPLAGMIYLQRIDRQRISDKERGNFRVFEGACGANAGKMLLVSTCWDGVGKAIAERRHQELRKTMWKSLIKRGARVGQFDNTGRAAWQLVDDVLQKHGKPPEKPRPTTQAKKNINPELTQRLGQQHTTIQNNLNNASQRMEQMKKPPSPGLLHLLTCGCIPPSTGGTKREPKQRPAKKLATK